MGDFLDVEEANQYPTCEVYYAGDYPVVQSGDAGFNMGFVTIMEHSYETCMKELDAIMKDICSPWFGY